MASDEEQVSSENPFEVSRVLSDTVNFQKAYASPYDFDLEVNLIVCGSHLILPPICVYTGATEDLVEIQRHTVFSSMRLVVVQRVCYVVTFMARSEQARRRKVVTVLGVITAIGSALLIAAFLLKGRQTAILFPIGLLIVGLSLLLLNHHNLPLKLMRYRAPGIYWVGGFSKAFLARLAIYKLNGIGRPSQITKAEI
jgi:hypothetical protein